LPLDPQAQASRPESGGWTDDDNAEIVRIRPIMVTQAVRFEVLQQWEGTVVDVDADGFVAHLSDKRDADAPLEKATIAFEEIAEQDVPLVEAGALFDWTIGYLTQPHGQKTTESTIVFRRMPRWSARDMERITREAAELDELFGDTH
jgi:hypothetical protein